MSKNWHERKKTGELSGPGLQAINELAGTEKLVSTVILRELIGHIGARDSQIDLLKQTLEEERHVSRGASMNYDQCRKNYVKLEKELYSAKEALDLAQFSKCSKCNEWTMSDLVYKEHCEWCGEED